MVASLEEFLENSAKKLTPRPNLCGNFSGKSLEDYLEKSLE